MEIDWHKGAFIDVCSGSLKLSAWARDCAGNAPFLSLSTEIDAGYAHMTLEQAEEFSRILSEFIRNMRQAEPASDLSADAGAPEVTPVMIEAGAGAPEIEITPAMTYAGVMAFYSSDRRVEDMEEIAAKIFRAMVAARVGT